MTNEELKKKIESIIRNAKRDFAYCVPEEWAVKVLADALIEAGMGDVKKEKFEADHYWNMRPFIKNRTSKKFTDIPLIVYNSKNACKDYEEEKKE